ncbi:MAG TPA: hypothetical protein VGU44_05040, partial [Gammaproteobacteria bacterium]|nr:hypothetical protein [Gammaproteobacteria bacterium]
FSLKEYKERLQNPNPDLERSQLNRNTFQNFKTIKSKIDQQQDAVSNKLLFAYGLGNYQDFDQLLKDYYDKRSERRPERQRGYGSGAS